MVEGDFQGGNFEGSKERMDSDKGKKGEKKIKAMDMPYIKKVPCAVCDKIIVTKIKRDVYDHYVNVHGNYLYEPESGDFSISD